MKRISLILIFALQSVLLAGQQPNGRVEDSLKKIANKPLPSDSHNEKKVVRWMRANMALGDYYQQQNLGKKALTCYKKISVLRDGCDSELGESQKAVELRNETDRKIADLLITGKGIKKNIAMSYEHAVAGCEGGREAFKKYSQRYFNGTKILYPVVENINLDTDTLFVAALNPFYIKTEVTPSLKNEWVGKLARAFLNQNNSNLILDILAMGDASMRSQMELGFAVSRLKEQLVDQFKIPADQINAAYEVMPDEPLKIKGLPAPYIEIRIKGN